MADTPVEVGNRLLVESLARVGAPTELYGQASARPNPAAAAVAAAYARAEGPSGEEARARLLAGSEQGQLRAALGKPTPYTQGALSPGTPGLFPANAEMELVSPPADLAVAALVNRAGAGAGGGG